MNGSILTDALQLLSGTMWLTVILSRLPAVWRAVTDRAPAWVDFFSMALVGNGMVQLGFVLRWWLYPAAKRGMEPGELTLWGCLYVTSATLALATHWLPRRA